MERLKQIVFVIVTILAISASVPKLMLMPREVEFFASIGLSTIILILFGVLQLAGGVLLALHRTRSYGAILSALMFLASALMLLFGGKTGLGVVSLLPTLFAVLVLHWHSVDTIRL